MQPPLFQQGPPKSAYLPEEFILGLKAALDEKRRIYEALPREIKELAEKYEAALKFAPPDFDPEKKAALSQKPKPKPRVVRGSSTTIPAPTSAPVQEKPFGWRRALIHVLNKDRRGFGHRQLLAQVQKEFPHLVPTVGDKSYYSAIGKLFEAGAAVKHGTLIFSPEALAEAKLKGLLPPIPEVGRRSGSSAEMIADLLGNYPAGLTANDMRERLRSVPGAPKSLYEHGQYIYGILGPMLGTGEVVKDGEVYRLSSSGAKK